MKSQTDRALSVLREMIFSGDLPPGTDHTEAEISDRLGMSRTPVREATLSLAAAGLVDIRPRKGFRVSSLSATDMGHIYEVLGSLEATAAANAAARQPDAAEMVAMAQAIDAMDAALADKDLDAWAEADDAFHAALVALGGNPYIMDIVAAQSDQVRRARRMTLRLRPLPTASNNDHRAVMEAIAAGDPLAAYQAHARHRRDARDMLTGLMETHGLSRL